MDGAQNYSRICMCIEFVIQGLKQKNAYVSLAVGKVIPIFSVHQFLHRHYRTEYPK